ncbi:membrane-associated protein, putative [Bodo saltans]|uniref:Membrane-associated protein, putative n=1 Tax=Bodo saltans TaxID=75058 RepID=A0A0S4JI10_BODSA|nr:membrane-associated protein, putative [Bodo saltans]|eukprot:CUG91137.1 membrane-associated protein, putative [Bodo saltans]
MASLVLFLMVATACLQFTSIDGWDGKWEILPRSERNAASQHYDDCVPLAPHVLSSPTESSPQEKISSRRKPLLRVYITTSPQIQSITANLVESLLTSFPAYYANSPSEDVYEPSSSAATMTKQELTLSTCRRWTSNGSLEFWKQMFASHTTQSPPKEEEGAQHHPYFPFSGLCIGIQELNSTSTNAGGTTSQVQRTRTGEDGSPSSNNGAGNTAKFGSAAYYDYLDQKLRYFTKRIAAFAASQVHVAPWALLLDADTQVFPGFFDMVAQKVLCPYAELQCQHTNYLDGCTGVAAVIASRGKTSSDVKLNSPERVDVFYQRESRRLVNTGLALVNMNSPGSLCLYYEALRRMQRSKYGDQTAIQFVLRQRRGYCASRVCPAVAAGGGVEELLRAKSTIFPLVRYEVQQQVFHKLHVNGNVMNTTYIVAHHAHMAGAHKIHALQKGLHLVRTDADRAQRIHHHRHGVTLHSGNFLHNHEDAACPVATAAVLSSLCHSNTARPTASVTACCVLHANQLSSFSASKEVVDHSLSVGRNTFSRRLTELSPQPSGNDDAIIPPPQLQTRTGAKRTSLSNDVSAAKSGAAAAADSCPTENIASCQNNATDDSNNNNTTVAPSKKSRRLKKSKALWTALPAIIIIITLTIFHFFVLNPSPPEDYSGVAPAPPSPSGGDDSTRSTTPQAAVRRSRSDTSVMEMTELRPPAAAHLQSRIPTPPLEESREVNGGDDIVLSTKGGRKTKAVRAPPPMFHGGQGRGNGGGFVSLRAVEEREGDGR